MLKENRDELRKQLTYSALCEINNGLASSQAKMLDELSQIRLGADDPCAPTYAPDRLPLIKQLAEVIENTAKVQAETSAAVTILVQEHQKLAKAYSDFWHWFMDTHQPACKALADRVSELEAAAKK